MTPLRQRFTQDLQIRNYAPRTITTYVQAIAAFARHFGRSPEQLDAEHIRLYQLHLIARHASWSRFNQAVCALRLLYRLTLQRPELVTMIPFGKKPKTLPCVLSTAEVRLLLQCASPPWFLTLLQLTYACGLRIGEVVRLRPGDIDGSRLVVHVRCAKGRKDRLVPISAALLDLLRNYWRQYRPQQWLFPSNPPGKHRNIGSVQRLFRRALCASGIAKKASMHTLRHSYATHLLEAGCNLFSLQKLLGHNQLSTTLRYTHIEQSHLQKVACPLDTLLALPPAEEHGCAIPPWMLEPSCDNSPAKAEPTNSD
jgi:integrase/recombinase XerD